ncbi:uncharacterized protein LOC114361962 [Ostrinia furnacalis]|uniref:uncharacterized protein LOC114361962 n=1 Tax=Ostrinia furnacalis TaxID=93504 RepID=UPI001039E04C|nr:uncharacterized protein LOC114361962 [Ostrinia furnacalis]
MMHKLVALCFVFGVVFAGPTPKLPTIDNDELDYPPHDNTNSSNQQISRTLPDVPAFLILDVINALVGNKFSTALSVGVFVIEWLVSNAIIIVVGAAAALGFCKITGKCSLNYEEYVPVSQLRSFVTPEYLETAENFFVSAIEKYAEKKGKAIRNRSSAY